MIPTLVRLHARPLSILLVLALAGCAHRPATLQSPASGASGNATPMESARPSGGTGDAGRTSSESALEFAAIHFGYDSAQLTPEAIDVLGRHLGTLRGDPALRVTIEGHCDERGTAEYNLALGERRAAAVRAWLSEAGVDGGRLRIVSYGKERPFASGHGEEDWPLNRRAQLVADRH